MLTPLYVSHHAIEQYRQRAILCCERQRSEKTLRALIEKQVMPASWRRVGGDTFVVEFGPLVPKSGRKTGYKLASVSYAFVIESLAVVTTLGFMMRPGTRKKQRRIRRVRKMEELRNELSRNRPADCQRGLVRG